MATIQKQVRMVFDLNKCLGCQTCTNACKSMWTDGRVDLPHSSDPANPSAAGVAEIEGGKGLLYQYWNNVSTMPGRGYPRGVFTPELRGGFSSDGTKPSTVDLSGRLPSIERDYGAPWEYSYDQVLKVSGGNPTASTLSPIPSPDGPNAYAGNWDEDVATGDFPNSYYFYLPRICNHCTRPACVEACPRQSIYKRAEDGIVLIDQNRCRGYRYCVQGCPYKKPYFNPTAKKTQKCVFCYPRVEQSAAAYSPPQPPRVNFCFNQCAGRIRFVGYYNPNIPAMDPVNQEKNVNRLIDKWQVAVRLHPEYGTQPNLFYIPPFSPPTFALKGRTAGQLQLGTQRVPVDFLADLFGDNERQSHNDRVVRIQQIFDTITTERKKAADGQTSELVDILTAHSESDRLQLHLG